MSTLAEIEAELPKLSAAELTELQSRVQSELRKKPTPKVEWPDFEARLKRNFPNGQPPGKPLSEIVDEARGEY